MEEIWKDIVGYEGYYQVSNIGRIRSVDRYVQSKGGGKKFVKGRMLVPQYCSNGYLFHGFCKNNVVKQIMLHRVVAIAFLPNPNNYPEVNHKDEDITNNCVDNLEWCTSKYNANYGTRKEKLAQLRRKPVNQLDLNGNFIRRWRSAKDACESLGIDRSGVMRVCKGRRPNYGGFKWEYA